MGSVLMGYQFEKDDLVWDHLLAFEEGVKYLEQGDLPKTAHLQQNPDHMEVRPSGTLQRFPTVTMCHMRESWLGSGARRQKRVDLDSPTLSRFHPCDLGREEIILSFQH
ncbi:UNVERIFIED_CONTAM: hypothetical protein K2H54_025903 [Gekko kuhli]